jgi:hypothetical protein
VVLHVSGYTFSDSKSRLGIKASLYAPRATLKDAKTGFRQFRDSIVLGSTSDSTPRGYLTWTASALVRCGEGVLKDAGIVEQPVIASRLYEVNYDSDIDDGVGKATINGNIYGPADARIIYFSVGGEAVNANEMYWDVSLGFGEEHRVAPLSLVWGITIIVVTILLVTTSCFFNDKMWAFSKPYKKVSD